MSITGMTFRQIEERIAALESQLASLQVERQADAVDAAGAIMMNVQHGTDAAAWKLIRRIAARTPTETPKCKCGPGETYCLCGVYE